jgi:hypothetical protein
MDKLGTILLDVRDEAEWSGTNELLTEEFGYRVVIVRSPAERAAALRDIHIDLAIAEDASGFDGRGFLSELRVSSPDVIRILAVDAQRPLTQKRWPIPPSVNTYANRSIRNLSALSSNARWRRANSPGATACCRANSRSRASRFCSTTATGSCSDR